MSCMRSINLRIYVLDINVMGIRQEVIDNISNSKIFINEMLSKDEFIQFKSLKAVLVD